MKANGAVTLMVHGKEMTFSEQELVAILEKHFPNEVTEQVATPEVTTQEVEFIKLVAIPFEADSFRQKKIKRVSRTFARNPYLTCQSILIADTVKAARLYSIGYCQTDQELRDDYYQYVYDNSFARRRRRKKY